MDLFFASCQGLGLALAAGTLGGELTGAAERRRTSVGPLGVALLLVGVAAGAVLFGLSLDAEDHPQWPGWVLGALLGAIAFAVWRGVVAGAVERAEAGSAAQIVGFVSIYVAVLVGVSLLLSPLALVALAVTVVLLAGRRRRAQRKYEGLRVLR